MPRLIHWQSILASAALVAASVAGPASTMVQDAQAGTTSTIPGPVVPASLFGMTIGSLGYRSGSPIAAGSLRLWDVGARWDQVETAPGTYNWTVLDRIVSNARAAGIKDIEYVMGSTPRWAAIPASATTEAHDLYGPGTASHPSHDQYYLDFLYKVAYRYRGSITSFEIWNEANLSIFYRGTPQQLATLTRGAYATLKRITPRPQLVAASITINGIYHPYFYGTYLNSLRGMLWPVDVFSAHLYPKSPYGPDYRLMYLNMVRGFLVAHGANKPIWDGEVNYGETRPGLVYQKFSGAAADAYVARTYIDSMRYGIARTYWYSWEANFLGISMSIADKPTEAATAFRTIKAWMVGKHWGGCVNLSNGANRCFLTAANGHHSSIWFVHTGHTWIRMPVGTTAVCRLPVSACTAVRAGSYQYLTIVPLLTYGA